MGLAQGANTKAHAAKEEEDKAGVVSNGEVLGNRAVWSLPGGAVAIKLL